MRSNRLEISTPKQNTRYSVTETNKEAEMHGSTKTKQQI